MMLKKKMPKIKISATINNSNILISLSILFFLTLKPLIAIAVEPEIVEELPRILVTDKRFEEPFELTDGSISVITHEKIEKKGYLTVEEALRDIDGIYIHRQGTIGEETTLRIRGSNRNHVLLMIDGVKINPPYNQTPSFEDIIIDNVERIEIAKGPRSSLYGSEAMAGVINIITRKAKENIMDFSVGAGNFGVHREKASTTFVTDYIEGTLLYSFTESSGQYEHDSFNGHSFSGSLGYALSDNTMLDFTSRYIKSSKELTLFCCNFDPFPTRIVMVWDQNAIETRETLVSNLSGTYYFSDHLDYKLSLSRSDYYLEMDNPGDQSNPMIQWKKSISYRNTFLLQQNIRFKAITIVTGIENEKESVSIKESGNGYDFMSSVWLPPQDYPELESKRYNTSYYLQGSVNIQKFHLTSGLRIDDNSQYGIEVKPRISSSYKMPAGFSIRGSYGRGIRAPSFDETYGSAMGNPNLEPEKSEGFDIGLKWSTDDNINLEITYFRDDYSELIGQGTDGGIPKYVNINNANIYGVESRASLSIKQFEFIINHTYIETVDNETVDPLGFRPTNQFNVTGEYSLSDFNITLMMNTVGSAYNSFPNLIDTKGKKFGEETPSYTVLNLSTQYKLPITWTSHKPVFKVKINNLLDREYEQIRGFPAQGINFLSEISIKL